MFRALEAQQASDIERRDDTITFAAGMFRFVSRSNVLSVISSGTVRVTSDFAGTRVHYTIRFTQLLVIVTAMVSFMGGAMMMEQSRPPERGLFPPLAFAIMWLWLFGGNFVTAFIRWRRFLRRTVTAASPP